MKKILIFSLTYLPFIGGAEIAVQEETLRLGKDFEFDLLSARLNKKLPKYEKIDNVNVYRLGFGFEKLDKYIFTFFGFFKAWRLHHKNKYQIAWPIMAAYSSFAVLFKIFFPKVKILLSLQEGDPIEFITSLKRFKIFKPIYKLYFKKVDKVQVISNYLAKWAKSLEIKEDKIVVVPNGVDLSKFKTQITKNKSDELKNRLGIKEEEKVIFTDSRLVEKNGVEDLIKAYKILITDYSLSITKLLIAGDGPLKNKLENLVKELNLENQVTFLGKVPYEKIQDYYLIADVFVRPSLSEGFGNAFIQAMAAEVPVIATPVGGILDFLEEGETGWLCYVENPQSIAEKIEYVLAEENKEEVARVVANAKKMVEEKYSWDRIANRIGGIFQDLLI